MPCYVLVLVFVRLSLPFRQGNKINIMTTIKGIYLFLYPLDRQKISFMILLCPTKKTPGSAAVIIIFILQCLVSQFSFNVNIFNYVRQLLWANLPMSNGSIVI